MLGGRVPSRRPVYDTTTSATKKKKKGTRHGRTGERMDAHAECVPHRREWLRDDVQHAHATTQKRDMVVTHVAQASVRRGARAEEAAAELGSVEDARVAQARLGADERVEEPGGIGEERAHERVRGAEEIEQDEVLDHREGRCWCRGGH
jgi:hypothetical protein